MLRTITQILANLALLSALAPLCAQPIPVDDVGDLPRHTVENEHMTGLLDHSTFPLVGRSNPHGPYPPSARNWTDVYGYTYDGDDPLLQGRRYAYVSTGGFSRRGGFAQLHDGGVAIFDVTHEGNPDYMGTYVPECTNPTGGFCAFLIRDVEIHDGLAYFSSDRAVDHNGGTFVLDLRANPIDPPDRFQCIPPTPRQSCQRVGFTERSF